MRLTPKNRTDPDLWKHRESSRFLQRTAVPYLNLIVQINPFWITMAMSLEVQEIRTWFNDGTPLKPVLFKPTRRKPKPLGEHERKLKHALFQKKKRRERWLDRIYRKRGPSNHINDKRQYYRTIYLKSEHWRRLKNSKLRSQPFCENCGTERTLDVHHIRYRNLYDVQLSDLQVLCRFCHAKEHGQVTGTKPYTIPEGVECPF